MIELKNACVVKSGVHLFNDFCWRIEPNEHWVISGPNGSGKTLLLELLAGSIHPTHGDVNYDFITGTTWDERFAERKQKIHYIPAHAIKTFLQGHELYYQQRYYTLGDERTPRVCDLFGDDIVRLQDLHLPPSLNIEQLLDLEVTRLSNGQLKKLVILRNLVRELPKLLLIDYPFEGLDQQSRSDLMEFLDHLARVHKIQLVIVDHDHNLPAAINKRLFLQDFKITSIEKIIPGPSQKTVKRTHVEEDMINETPVVEMRNVTIRYNKKEIIKNLNWVVNKGERWALTGKNGSGKTTVFSLIFADHPMAYSEKVYLFGKRRGSGESIWDIKKRINYLGPELISYLNPQHITTSARDYVMNHHKNIDRKAFEKALDYFEADLFASKPVRSLSSGQLQLMLMISSLISDKELLLLDEPFQFLDPVNKQRLSEYIQLYLRFDSTLILITHYEQDITYWTQKRMRL